MNSAKPVLQAQPEQSVFKPGFIYAGAVLIMVFVMGLPKLYSPDPGFHLKSAARMPDNKQFIRYDSFSHRSSAHKYFDLQWPYQLLIYTFNKKIETVLVIANALFISVSLVLCLNLAEINGWDEPGRTLWF
jgi:hypothetical protein